VALACRLFWVLRDCCAWQPFLSGVDAARVVDFVGWLSSLSLARMRPGQQQPQQQQRQGWNWTGLLLNGLVIYGIFSFMNRGKDAVDPQTGKQLPPHRALFSAGEILV